MKLKLMRRLDPQTCMYNKPSYSLCSLSNPLKHGLMSLRAVSGTAADTVGTSADEAASPCAIEESPPTCSGLVCCAATGLFVNAALARKLPKRTGSDELPVLNAMSEFLARKICGYVVSACRFKVTEPDHCRINLICESNMVDVGIMHLAVKPGKGDSFVDATFGKFHLLLLALAGGSLDIEQHSCQD